jgi:hypothetical protein
MTHKENHNPSCTVCGALTYFVAEDGKHYCHDHLDYQGALFNKALNGALIRLALTKYQENLHAYNGEPDFDTWDTIGYYWDLNTFISPNGVLQATLYPVRKDGTTDTSVGFPLVIDQSLETSPAVFSAPSSDLV